MATTPLLCANWYLAAALNTTSVISESIGIGVATYPVHGKHGVPGVFDASKEPGRQRLSSIAASTLSEFFPSAASIGPASFR